MKAKYEKSDADPKYVMYFGIGLAATIAAVGLLMWLLFGLLARHDELALQQPAALAPMPEVPPQPRLQVAPESDAAAAIRMEMEILNRYEWIDPEQGRARIPIERAMDIIAEKGLPVR